MKQNNIQLNRQEFKYYVAEEKLESLRQSLTQFMEIDQNSIGQSNSYTITSIYFDTPFEEDFEEKVDGIKSREKFRIRIYNNNYDLIKFESKKRVETVIKKTSAVILKEDIESLCNGDYSSFRNSENEFLQMSYSKLVSGGYRPIIVVEYELINLFERLALRALFS